MIGDPTGQSETRVALSKQKVLENAKTYERQIFKILDPDEDAGGIQQPVDEHDDGGRLIDLTAHYSVARMLERDDFRTLHRAETHQHS